MPTYDYRCNACGHAFELFQSITEGKKRRCPECGKLKLERLYGTGAGILFKGSGFYETDYRSSSYKEAAEKDRKSGEPKKDDAQAKPSDAKAADAKAADAKSPSKPPKKEAS